MSTFGFCVLAVLFVAALLAGYFSRRQDPNLDPLDRERLDWLQYVMGTWSEAGKVPKWTFCEAERQCWWRTADDTYWEDLRAAIDHARKL